MISTSVGRTVTHRFRSGCRMSREGIGKCSFPLAASTLPHSGTRVRHIHLMGLSTLYNERLCSGRTHRSNTHMYTYAHACTHTHAHTRMYTRTHARTHAHTHTRIHARTHTHVHMHTRTHEHTHTRTHAHRAASTRTHTIYYIDCTIIISSIDYFSVQCSSSLIKYSLIKYILIKPLYNAFNFRFIQVPLSGSNINNLLI